MKQVYDIGNSLLADGKKWLSGKQKINPGKIVYMPEFKLGKPINSGIDADVFELEGYPDLVARVHRKSGFVKDALKRVEDNVRNIWASNADGSVTIMKKIKGIPLHGKGWEITSAPNKEAYLKTLDEMIELPDSAYIDYLRKLRNIRSNEGNTDLINPNNILFDRNDKEINIVDIGKTKYPKIQEDVKDFYPFIDAHRLKRLMEHCNPSERKIITDKVKQFLSKIEKIGEKQGVDLKVEEVDHSKLQDFVTYLAKDDEEMLKLFLD